MVPEKYHLICHHKSDARWDYGFGATKLIGSWLLEQSTKVLVGLFGCCSYIVNINWNYRPTKKFKIYTENKKANKGLQKKPGADVITV